VHHLPLILYEICSIEKRVPFLVSFNQKIFYSRPIPLPLPPDPIKSLNKNRRHTLHLKLSFKNFFDFDIEKGLLRSPILEKYFTSKYAHKLQQSKIHLLMQISIIS